MSENSDHSAVDGAHHNAGGFGAWFDSRFRSAPAVYGLIVFTAFITIASDHAVDAWDMLDTAVGTLIVFFIAHVFAHTLTSHGEHGLWRAIRHGIAHASGMLYASIPTTLVLVITGVQGASADDAYISSMWVAVAMLALLGYSAYAKRGAHIIVRLFGAAGTALLGLVIILLEYAIH
ncbi:hypothetical protein FHX48_000838 [Microbacterium halimionae]|uniref:Uncharacterized protein n=1 Tax=Microbacterium halimionae TaxID=1526413 RepID=A0A7W3PLA1_9MICO|nr:hypothetical protein [Microbacterium halimionae]MBA8815786.1 hypothetical protein [Microbacterium halimionae]NII95832.1 hypothetical protein [Microbacterium halimionae]